MSTISKQSFYEGTIPTATNDLKIELTGINTVRDIVIFNDSAGTLEFKINSTSFTAIKLLSSEDIVLEDVNVGVVYLSNNSGASINYRIICLGK